MLVMKRVTLATVCLACAVIFLFSKGDTAYGPERSENYVPVYMTRAELEGSVKYLDGERGMSDPGKIYVYGDRIFVNEKYRGVHVIDNSDPYNPRRLHTRTMGQGGQLKRERDMKRIFVSVAVCATLALAAAACSSSADGGMPSQGGGGEGQGGSMARFTIVGDCLYTVDHTTLKVVDISNPAHPGAMPFKDVELGFDIETIFYYDDMLFIGSRSAMHIYDISRPHYPSELSVTRHFTSCDPVVADGGYAYVTLNSDNASCWRGTDALQVYDIADPKHPFLVSADEKIRSPKGLGVDAAAGRLFVCCKGGLKVYDLAEPGYPVWVDDLTNLPEVGSIDAYDVIPRGGLLILIGADGLYQFDYTEENLSFVSKIDLRTL